MDTKFKGPAFFPWTAPFVRFGPEAMAASSSAFCVPVFPLGTISNEHTLAPRTLPAVEKKDSGDCNCEGQVSSELGGWSRGPSLVFFEAWRGCFQGSVGKPFEGWGTWAMGHHSTLVEGFLFRSKEDVVGLT